MTAKGIIKAFFALLGAAFVILAIATESRPFLYGVLSIACFMVAIFYKSGLSPENDKQDKQEDKPEAAPTSETEGEASAASEPELHDESNKAADVEPVKKSKKRFPRIATMIKDEKEIPVDDKYHYYNVRLDPILAEGVEYGDEVEVEFEDDKVLLTKGEQQVARLERPALKEMAFDWLKKRQPIAAQIDGTEPLTAELVYYRPHPTQAEYERRNVASKEYRLVGCNREEFEYSLLFAKTGTEYNVSYDVIEERYETDIGYLPKSAAAFLHKENTVGFVTAIEEDEDGKPIVKMQVYEYEL